MCPAPGGGAPNEPPRPPPCLSNALKLYVCIPSEQGNNQLLVRTSAVNTHASKQATQTHARERTNERTKRRKQRPSSWAATSSSSSTCTLVVPSTRPTDVDPLAARSLWRQTLASLPVVCLSVSSVQFCARSNQASKSKSRWGWRRETRHTYPYL